MEHAKAKTELQQIRIMQTQPALVRRDAVENRSTRSLAQC